MDDRASLSDWIIPHISAIISLKERRFLCVRKYTPDELKLMDHDAKNEVICQMQDRLDKLGA